MIKLTFTNMARFVDFVGEAETAEEAITVIADILKVENSMALTGCEEIVEDGEQE